MWGIKSLLLCSYIAMAVPVAVRAAPEGPQDPCPRPAPGSPVPEPRDLHSQNGILKLDLTVRDHRESDGSVRYCYLLADGTQSPTLRLHPGDLLILNLRNELSDPQPGGATPHHGHSHTQAQRASDPCTSGAMSPISTNLHFHGLTVPPVCHQDDV